MTMALWIVILAAAVIVPLAAYWLYSRTRPAVPSPKARFRMPVDASGHPPTETEEMRRMHAAADAQRAADAAPTHGPLQGTAGRKLIRANRFETAVPYLRRAVEHAPTADHMADLGFALLATERLDEASYYIKQARSQDPTHADAWFYWSLILAAIDCQGESNRELEAMIATHPRHAAAKAELAQRWENRGNHQQALMELESALEQEPDFIPARVNLVRVLCKRGQFLDARPQLHWLMTHGVPVEVITRGDELHVSVNGAPLFDGSLSGG